MCIRDSFGAVRDKAPSDPTRAPYYSQGPGPNPTTDGGPQSPDARAPDGAPLGPPPPTLLAKLVQVSNPRRLAIANDRVWVRGAIGLAFLDSRGPSGPTEIGQLPEAGGVTFDLGTTAVVLAATGNSACTATVVGQKTARWCYDLTSPTRADASTTYINGLLAVGSQIITIAGSRGIFVDYPTYIGNGNLDGVIAPGEIAGMALTTSNQGLIAVVRNQPSIRLTTNPIGVSDMSANTIATFTAPYDPFVGRIEIASNVTEVFFASGRPDTLRGGIFRKKFSEAGPAPGTLLTETNVPYASGADGTTMAADANYVYWAGGAAGPMAMSTCTTKPVAPKALFPSAGAQDNTTFAVAKAGSKLFFATNDGRVYSMDPPAVEACP